MKDEKASKMLQARHEELLTGLLWQGFERERAEAVVHALVDIAESVEKIYGTMLPELMNVLDQPGEVFKNKLWDIREEFRHIEYHLDDSKLAEL